MTDVRGRKALVAGGSSGIGLELSKLLAGAGCSVTILGRSMEKLAAAQGEIAAQKPDQQGDCAILQADITESELLTATLSAWIAENGVPDILVNCAGASRPGMFLDVSPEDFRAMMDVNYFGTVNVTRAILPGMLERAAGHIVFLSSVAGFLGMVGYTAYAPAKFAVRGFADSLRTELQGSGVRLSIVFPPDTETPGLVHERPFQPPVLRAMNENAKAMSARDVAAATFKGIQRNRYLVTPGFDSSFYFKLVGLLGGGLVYPVLDLFLADARRKVRLHPEKYSAGYVRNPDEGGQ